MTELLDTAGIDRAELLAALYNRAQPLGLGMLQYDPTPMTPAEAQQLIDTTRLEVGGRQSAYFDYLKGRPLKVDVLEDEMRVDLYDRDQGYGAAANVVAGLRQLAS